MTTLSNPREYSATPGEEIQITVQSVNFVINARLDTDVLTVSQPDDFTKVGKFTMGNADTTFIVTFVFPDPLPAGGKYTYTVKGQSGSDGPHDVLQIGSLLTETLPFKVRAAAAAAGGGTGRES
jgi:hypothetical protein